MSRHRAVADLESLAVGGDRGYRAGSKWTSRGVVMICIERLITCLQEAGIAYDLHRRPHPSSGSADRERVPAKQMARVVMVVADGELVMLVLPAPCHVDLSLIRPILHAKEVRLAYQIEVAAVFPDCEPGALPPFGNLYGVSVYADPALYRSETIGCLAGTHTDTIRLRFLDWVRLVKPHMISLFRPSIAHTRAAAYYSQPLAQV